MLATSAQFTFKMGGVIKVFLKHPLPRDVTKMKSVIPAARASSIAYWISGRSTKVMIYFRIDLVMGKNRVPILATGKIALVTLRCIWNFQRNRVFLNDVHLFLSIFTNKLKLSENKSNYFTKSQISEPGKHRKWAYTSPFSTTSGSWFHLVKWRCRSLTRP